MESLAETQDRKRKLDREILALVRAFREETDLELESIEVIKIETIGIPCAEIEGVETIWRLPRN